MQKTLKVLAALAGAATGVQSFVSKAVAENPLGKVVDLLSDLERKINLEADKEAKAYREFVDWCDDAAKNVKFELETAEADRDRQEAAIGKAAGDAEAAGTRIEELAGSVSESEAELKSATKVRESEAADFKSTEAELVESIDTVGRAVGVLQREMNKNPNAFAQVDTSSFGNFVNSVSSIVDAAALEFSDKKRLMGLVQAQQEAMSTDINTGAPAAAVYKSRSGDIVDILEDLKEKAEEELGNLRTAERNARHNYEMVKQSLEDQMKADNKDLTATKVAKSASLEAKATAERDLSATVKEIVDGKKRQQLATNNCMTVAADHEATLAARKEELKVIAVAKEHLTSTSDGAVSQTYTFIQTNSQVHSRLVTHADLANIEVVALVKKLAKDQKSAALSQLASRINSVLRFGSSAGEDPFAKVRALITDMITRLKQEAGSEANEKAYCDEQMAETQAKKDDLQAALDSLTSKIDKKAASSVHLKGEVQQLQTELLTLLKSQKKMDELRSDEHTSFVQTKADLETGLQGVRKAISVLREYYGSAAPALIQTASFQPAMPEVHAKAGGAANSIIGMLEVVESDFAKNLAASETEEDDAQSQYDSVTQQNKITKTVKESDVKYKTQEFKGLDKDVAEHGAERSTSTAEMEAVLEYDRRLKERCIAKPMTYEERKRRRTAEIDGLKEALTILEDETSLVQKKLRGGHRHVQHVLTASK